MPGNYCQNSETCQYSLCLDTHTHVHVVFSLVRSFWCVACRGLEVIGHCYAVDIMVICCFLIRQLESSFSPTLYLFLSVLCGVIYLYAVFIYLYIIMSHWLELPWPSSPLGCSICNSCLVFLFLFPETNSFIWLIAGILSASLQIFAPVSSHKFHLL